MDLFKKLHYDLQIKIYEHYDKERKRKLDIYIKKKKIIGLLKNIYRVICSCKYVNIICLMQSCGTTMCNSDTLTYYEYWTILDWTLWEFIIYVKNNLVERRLFIEDTLTVGYERFSANNNNNGTANIIDYMRLWNYIYSKYIFKIPFNYDSTLM